MSSWRASPGRAEGRGRPQPLGGDRRPSGAKELDVPALQGHFVAGEGSPEVARAADVFERAEAVVGEQHPIEERVPEAVAGVRSAAVAEPLHLFLPEGWIEREPVHRAGLAGEAAAARARALDGVGRELAAELKEPLAALLTLEAPRALQQRRRDRAVARCAVSTGEVHGRDATREGRSLRAAIELRVNEARDPREG